MNYQLIAYISPMLVAGTISVILMAYAAANHRNSVHLKIFVFIMASLSIWSFGYALELYSSDLSTSLLLAKFEYIGIMSLPVSWLAFALYYGDTGEKVTRRNIALLSIVPLIELVICWTNYNHLFYKSVEIGTGVLSPIKPSYGPAFWLNIFYSYALIFAGIYFFLKKAVELGRTYARQGIVLAVGVVAPIAGNIIYLSNLSPLPEGYDITPVLFVFTGLVLLWLIFSHGFLDITPIACGSIFKNIEDGIVIIDNKGKIINFNEAGRKFISPKKIGDSIGGILPSDILEGKKTGEIKRRRRYYDVRVSQISDRKNRLLGEVVILRDITGRKKAEERVNQLNDTLRLINKIMRHDILNDLQIANGSLELYTEGKSKTFIEKAMQRINRSIKLIEMMRNFESMVSSGKELKEYSVRKVVEDVVKDYDVKFDIKGDCTIMADEAFRSVIDNIVRNAIVHGGTDKIDITMESRGDECEIRIADYGKGIPDEIKKRIFDESFKHGKTGGTGLGLYIVKKTVERYGGSIHVEDNEPRGAVFVIKLKKGDI